MSSITTRTTSNPSSEELETFISLLSHAYLQVPLTTAFITEIDGVSPSPSSSNHHHHHNHSQEEKQNYITPSRLQQHFSLGVKAVAQSNILLSFAYPSTSSTTKPIASLLLEPPSFTGIPPSQARRQPGPILQEYRRIASHLKSKHLAIPDTGPKSYVTPAAPSQSSAAPSEDPFPAEFNKDAGVEIRGFYHLAFVVGDLIHHDDNNHHHHGDETESHGVNSDKGKKEQGYTAVKKLIKEVQDRARQDDVGVWLTTSEEGAMREFTKEDLGFRVCEEVVVGKGRVDKDGWPRRDGEGVRVWGLLWE